MALEKSNATSVIVVVDVVVETSVSPQITKSRCVLTLLLMMNYFSPLKNCKPKGITLPIDFLGYPTNQKLLPSKKALTNLIVMSKRIRENLYFELAKATSLAR